MANIRNFKKDLTNVYGSLLDECFYLQVLTKGKKAKEIETLEQKIEAQYDKFMGQINERKVENRGKFIASLHKEFNTDAQAIVSELNGLE